MSAEKCGVAITASMLDEAVKRALEPRERTPVIISPRGYKVLARIKKKFPDWEPTVPSDVWIKAYRMGLLEEEE